MATYLVGDLHGCYDEFKILLDRVSFNPKKDKLYLTGDLIARGDKSLECLRLVKSLGKAASFVLGNHDLHFLATAYGLKEVKKRDKVDAIFEAPDFIELREWLRKQPLLIETNDFVLVHAGISPDWDLALAKECAKEAEQELHNGNYKYLLTNMYANEPAKWSNELTGIARLRYILNVYSRMRFCYKDGSLNFAFKGPLNEAPADLYPWYKLHNPVFTDENIIFGHWASLVDTPTPTNIYALDTGCVWNNRLTLLRWEDKQVFSQRAVKDYSK